jgi:glycerophosphoryl diester phosphodiesterase
MEARCKLCYAKTEFFSTLQKKYFCDSNCLTQYKEYKEWKLRLGLQKEPTPKKEAESFDENIALTGGYPVLCAHRGGGFEFAPENTLYAFKKSVEHGARVLELDIRRTKDQELVLMHWSTVDETTDGNGAVAQYTLAELLELDAAVQHPTLKGTGIKVPTLREFMDTFVDVKDLLFFFDFKDTLTLKMTLQFIKPYKIEGRYALGSVIRSTNATILEIRDSPKVPVCTDIVQSFEITGAYYCNMLSRYTFDHDIYGFVLCRATSYFWRQGLVEAIHEAGRRVAVSSYGNELNKMERLKECIAFGVDFIMTDRPDLLQSLLKK